MWWLGIKYERLELLGEGSQGQVFKALRRDRKTHLSQIVAIKVLHSETAVDLWRREFESLRRIRSHHCVQLLAFDRVDGRPALVLEYVDGVSLQQLVQKIQLSGEEVNEILAQAEVALRELTAAGLCHGDLSPANIMIDHEGTVKLLDFGLANLGGKQARFTPEFAAPERLKGGNPNYASDLYSLGRMEIFLRGPTTREKASKNYLHPEPQCRRSRNFSSRAGRRARLARKVRDYKTYAAWTRSNDTQPLNSPAQTSSPAFGAILVLASAVFLTSSTALSTVQPKSWATLTVRTLKWHMIEIDGKTLGYAPLTVTIPAGKSLTLRWQRADGRGRKALRAGPGQRMVMSDQDF